MIIVLVQSSTDPMTLFCYDDIIVLHVEKTIKLATHNSSAQIILL